MDLDEFVRQIWEIRESVHVEIDSVRTEVYKIHGHKRDWKGSSKLQAEQTKKLDDDAFQIMQTAQENINHLPLQNSKNLNDLAQTAEQTARKLQRNTEQVTSATPVSVLLMTTKAGFLLSLTERVMFGYARLGSSTPKPDDDVVLSAAMTVVASARDQLTAAQGHMKNLKEEIGSAEKRRLFRNYLLPSVLLYVVFNPQWWGSYGISWLRPYWEVAFWSVFGAVAFSVISISEDTNSEVFDPRNVGKYTYRIPVAPLVSFAIIASLNVLGFTITSSGTGGGGTFVIDFVKPNLFLLVVLSFLLGFFSKRSIEILDVVWKRLFDWDKTTKDAGADATTPKKPKKENGSRPKTATNSQGGSGPQKDTSGRSPVLSQAYTKSPEGSFEGTSPRRGTTQGESDLKPGLQDKSSESSPGFDTAHIDASDASETDDLVWYVAYGSNLLKKPLKLYLEGGAPSPNARVHRECPWGTEVQGDQAYKLGFELYFACKSSETWGKGGVAFVETKNVTPPPTLGRAYLLTIQQLGHVAMEENGWTDPVTIRKPDLSARSLVLLRETGRYRVLLPCRFLGKIPVVTLTGVPEETKPRNLPSEDYLNTIRKGLHETYLAMTELEIDEYLSRKLDPSLVAKVWSR